ncbi:TPA: hypothetical protein ACKQC2_000731 [Stenotrophomonas maltophilia]
MSTDKTLADVQPGGRVRLGDQAELDRHEFQAWARELLPCPFCGNGAEFVPYKDNGLTLKCKSMGCIQRNQRTLRYGIDWLRTSMAEHWNTRALSAQPSPGGQDALSIEKQARELLAVEYERAGETWAVWAIRNSPMEQLIFQIKGALLATIAALAARQPVYEGHTWISDYVLAGLRERAAMPLQLRNGEVWHWQGDGHDFPESLVCPVIMSAETLRALLAARQPVRSSTVSDDMMDVVDRLGSEHDEVDPRAWDHMLIYAPTEKLAARLAARQPVGEPFGWLIARPDVSPFFVPASHPEIVECFRTELAAEVGTTVTEVFTTPQPPAQAVDLEQFRPLASYVIEQAAGTRGDMHMLACQLLALIDSQAVGK